jgi:hypothetical protein
MKLIQASLLALACGAAPLAVHAGVEIGINIGGPEIVVRTQPPQLREEVVTLAPGPGYIWIRGHWAWRHERWEWMGGRWDRVAQPGLTWIPGRWAERANGWVWVEGHYAVVAAPAPPPPGQQVEVIASEEPPIPIVEVVPLAPGPEYFWIGGHWHWNGGWVWMRGHYDRHPHFHPGAGWVAGRWDRRGGIWAWHEGHWR